MTDPRSIARPRGLRIGTVSVLVAVVLLVALFTGILLGRRQALRDAGPPAASLTQPVTAAGPTAPASAPVDPAQLTAREAVLAGQIAALEARAATLAASAEAAGGQASRAESLLTAVAARRAIDRGTALGALDGQLVQRFGATQPRAVAIVRAVGRQPVTLEELRQGLDAVGPAAAAGVSDGWWDAIRRELGQLVVLRRAGTPSPRPLDHLARAKRLLAADQVDAARAEVAQLPGVTDAANWLAAARRYALARQALDVLETTALTSPSLVPVPAVAAPTLPAG